MGLSIAALAAAPGLAHAQGADLFYERAVMQAADQRCGLFPADVGRALASAAAQARGAALRAGASPESLRATSRAAAARAEALDCASPALAADAQRVRAAFAGFVRIGRLSYPGDVAAWQADRWSRTSAWRLEQHARFGADSLTFGLAGREDAQALVAVAQFADGARPYAARLVLRDASRTPGPYLDRWTGGPTAGLPLSHRLPPTGLATYMAEVRAPAGRDLLPSGGRQGWAFRFPAAAARALAALDPREAVAVEFLFPDGAARRAYIEVGDFAAGEAFLQASLP
ncbi:MAG TPA: hypothetical protein VLI41_12680 [Phenylobacterium sp.]|uniref:hypothetical protein n=1 Tax=Phenylobacterium sp. TaxID=1871053 RepID=UPI002C373B4A|nr:hypothetical protein [Phenylobacterium sp.]HSV04051.1 hypothetical protein [Phenylobacterium sp.]